MRKIITEDNSVTFYNDDVEDHYHSKSGAVEEAFEKHAKALELKENCVIFDMFFGLGYNAAAALDLISNCTIYCFENDKEILQEVLNLDEKFKSWDIIKTFVKNFLENNETVFEKDGIKLVMLYGDACETIKEVSEKGDFVFFDPFSPAKVPELWSEEFFTSIKTKLNEGAKLSTYSYARFVKDNLKNAGFTVIDGPVVGRRSPSTIAVNGEVEIKVEKKKEASEDFNRLIKFK